MKSDQTTILHGNITRPAGTEDAAITDNTATTVIKSNAIIGGTIRSFFKRIFLSRRDGTPTVVHSGSPDMDNVIEKGNTILGLYHIVSDPFVGGFGCVFRVHHTGWKVDLAMKQPKRDVFQTQKQKEDFTTECKHWINLGLHPHIVSCYYVREIDGIPSIFSEWMDGGSLKDWINEGNGRLYEVREEEVRERIFDIAIQFARGLYYANEQDLIHQDVKPENLLLTNDGTAKVADFGIANARVWIAGNDAGSSSGTIVSHGHAYTPAYCSPEQKTGRELTRRTDIWSWAVSVLEMFMGDRLWNDGTVAGMACEDYFGTERITMPEAMKDLLRWCFKENEAERPHDFSVVETELLKIYQAETGRVYPRPEPKVAADTADSLNNWALSFLDLGMKERAIECLDKALAVSPNHSSSLYNKSLILWRDGKITDIQALNNVKRGNVLKKAHLLAQLHLERCSPKMALNALEDTFEKDEEAIALRQIAREMLERGECFTNLRKVVECDSEIVTIAWSTDGTYILLTTRNNPNTVMLYHAQTGECLRSFSCRAPYSLWSCFSPDNRLVAVADDKDILIWKLETGQKVGTLTGHHDEINRIIFSANGRRLLSCSCDGTAVLWDLKTGRPVQIYGGHGCYVSSCCLSPDETIVLTGDYSGIIRVWDTKTGRLLNRYGGHNGHIRSLCVSSDNIKSLSIGADLVLKLWYVNSGYCETKIVTGIPPVSSLCFEKGGDRVFVFNGEWGKNAFIDAQTGRYLQTIDDSDVRGFAFYPFSDGHTWLFVNTNNSSLSLMYVPAFRYRSAFELCRVESSKKITQLEENFRKQVKGINQLIENRDIAAALGKADELKKMPVWGNTKAVLEIRREIGKNCIKTGISQIIKGSTVSWIESLYDLGRATMFGISLVLTFSPIRLITAFANTSAVPVSGVVGRSIHIRDIRTGKLVTTWDAFKDGERLTSIIFNKEGNKLLAMGEKSKNIDRIWLGKVFNLDSMAEELTISSTTSSADLKQQAETMDFNEQTTVEYASAQHIYCPDKHINLPKSDKDAKAMFFSVDGNQIGVVYFPSSDDDNCCEYIIYDIDWEYHFPGWQDWDEGARPYLDNFLTIHPNWTDENFNNILIPDLQNRGYGWLRPEGVRAKLEELKRG